MAGTRPSERTPAVPPSGHASTNVPRPKLQIPRLPDRSLPRPRLVRWLMGIEQDAARDPALGAHLSDNLTPQMVTQVCAPAGYGKSTLLAAYASHLREHGVLVAWVTCDRHDNDPAHLWSAMLASMSAALRRAGVQPDGRHPDPFAAMTPPPRDMEPEFLAEFVEAVDTLAMPVALILDDSRLVSDPLALAGLDELLRNLPEHLLLTIGCRYDPPLALPRLRLEGRLRKSAPTNGLHDSRGGRAAGRRADIAVRAGSGTAARAHGGVAGGTASGGTVVARRAGSVDVRGHVRRRPARRRRLSGCRSAVASA